MSNNIKTKIDLGAFASETGGDALQSNAEELRTMIGSSAPGGSSLTRDQGLVLNLKYAWSQMYGEMDNWPQELQRTYHSIEAGIGLGSFKNDLTAALQNLQLSEVTVPAFEIAISVADRYWISRLKRADPASSFIPASAARAGLSFVSNPANLVLPIFTAGLAGRAVAGLVTNSGAALQLAGEAVSALSLAISLPVEAAAFMGSSSVIASAPWSSSLQAARNEDDRRTLKGADPHDTLTEFAASTAFFAGLKFFGWVGSLAQSLLPFTEVGMTLAKLTGHASSIFGLAATEEIQEKMGNIAIANSASHPRKSGDLVNAGDSRFRGNDNTTFYDKLWRAAFLHGTVQTVYGVVDLKGATSNSEAIIAQAQGYIDTLRANMSPEAALATAGAGQSNVIPAGVSGDLVRSLNSRVRGNATVRSDGGEAKGGKAANFLPMTMDERMMAKLEKGHIIIGKNPSADFVVSDKRASDIHAVIERKRDGAFILYNKSRSYTKVNDVQVFNLELIGDGDIIEIAGVKFVFRTPETRVSMVLVREYGLIEGAKRDLAAERVFMGQAHEPSDFISFALHDAPTILALGERVKEKGLVEQAGGQKYLDMLARVKNSFEEQRRYHAEMIVEAGKELETFRPQDGMGLDPKVLEAIDGANSPYAMKNVLENMTRRFEKRELNETDVRDLKERIFPYFGRAHRLCLEHLVKGEYHWMSVKGFIYASMANMGKAISEYEQNVPVKRFIKELEEARSVKDILEHYMRISGKDRNSVQVPDPEGITAADAAKRFISFMEALLVRAKELGETDPSYDTLINIISGGISEAKKLAPPATGSLTGGHNDTVRSDGGEAKGDAAAVREETNKARELALSYISDPAAKTFEQDGAFLDNVKKAVSGLRQLDLSNVLAKFVTAVVDFLDTAEQSQAPNVSFVRAAVNALKVSLEGISDETRDEMQSSLLKLARLQLMAELEKGPELDDGKKGPPPPAGDDGTKAPPVVHDGKMGDGKRGPPPTANKPKKKARELLAAEITKPNVLGEGVAITEQEASLAYWNLLLGTEEGRAWKRLREAKDAAERDELIAKAQALVSSLNILLSNTEPLNTDGELNELIIMLRGSIAGIEEDIKRYGKKE